MVTKIQKVVVKILPGLFLLGIIAAGWFVVHELDMAGESQAMEESPPAEHLGGLQNLVTLPDGKLQAAKLKIEPIQERMVQHHHWVPGRLRYDQAKHIHLKAPVSGILIEVLATPGDNVQKGDLLAVISSPDIGKARADVLKSNSELKIVSRKYEREKLIADNLKRLFDELKQNKSISQLEKIFAGVSLGKYREQILAAYSKDLLARDLIKKIKPLANTGSVSGRLIRQRESEQQVAHAAYQAICDQALFSSVQNKMQAETDLADAKRRLRIARQHLETILGYSEDVVESLSANQLSRLEIRAPFAGTIESRIFAKTERVELSAPLFILADTSTLYVAADIRENDWPAVGINPGQEIDVQVPAISDQTFSARVHYIGREVSVDSNSVPLIAIIDNSASQLRPGMFVRVAVPLGDSQKKLAVRPKAIFQYDNKQFVFVAVSDNQFQQVEISTGIASDQWVEVKDGLKSGQLVVTEGAFLLKSELLLEGEE